MAAAAIFAVCSVPAWAARPLYEVARSASQKFRTARAAGMAAAAAMEVRVFPEVLEAIDNEELEVLLPDGRGLTVVKQKQSAEKNGGTVWTGKVKGQPDSFVVFSKVGDAMTATLSLEGGQLFRLAPKQGTLHTLEALKPAPAEELEPIEVTLPDNDSLPFPSVMADDGSTIDVLVAYTAEAAGAAGGQNGILALINQAISETNQSYANSGIRQRVRLAQSAQVAYTESGDLTTDLVRLKLRGDGFMEEIFSLRDSAAADLVVLLAANGGNACGVGYLMTQPAASFEEFAFSVVDTECATGYYSFGHEMGHNMGARHDRFVDNVDNSPYPYNHGYFYVPGRWRTIMAYDNGCQNAGESCTRIPHWSNPDVSYTGIPTGVPNGQATAADNRTTLNNTALVVSNFRAANRTQAQWSHEFGSSSGWLGLRNPRAVADVNGDGRADVVGFGESGTWVGLSTGTSFAAAQLWLNQFGASSAAGGWNSARYPRAVADVNGDGRADVVGFGEWGVLVALSTGSSFSPAQLWLNDFGASPSVGGWNSTRYPRILADADGDGRSDIIAFSEWGVLVALSTGSGFAAPQYWIRTFGASTTAGGWDSSRHVRTASDVDGDGRADIVGFGEPGVQVALSNGGAFRPPTLWLNQYGASSAAGAWNDSARYPRVVADMDGDGRGDVVGFGHWGTLTSPSTGTSFAAGQMWIAAFGASPSVGGWDGVEYPRFAADVTGNGRADIVGFGANGVFVSSN
jgi:hypothetical protein